MKAVINLNETTEIKSDLNGNITNSNSFGSISVSNPSKETTLWAISLKGKHGGEVLDFNNQSIQHIQPGKVFEDKYKIQSENKILIKERIDTAVEGTSTDDLNEKRNTLIKGLNQRVLYELTISNNYSFPLKNVELIKTLPDCTEGVDTVPPHPGNIDPTQTPLTWSIDHIDKDSSVTLYLIVDLKPINSKKVETGKIELKANGVGIFSSLDPSIDAECDNVDLSVDVAETQSPGEWNIKVEYTNSSEFATKLETIQVGLPDKVFINEEIQQMIKPKSDGVAWSKTASIKSPDYPEINKNFKYQVDFEVTKSSEITYLKDTNFL
ncbi:MAG: hypothetical protein OEZ01_18160, partial [Candidatus Heimdallarchaeota archaeon]|nr:hypothetical protein [Candidatus Heimdallarchaeota archaeon]